MKKHDTPLAPTALDEILDRDAAERRHRAVAERAEKDAALRQAIDARNELVTEDDKARLGIDKEAAEALLGAVERDALPTPPSGAAARRPKTTQRRVIAPGLASAPLVVPIAAERRRLSPLLLAFAGLAVIAFGIALAIALRGEPSTPVATTATAVTPPVVTDSPPEPTAPATIPTPGSSLPAPQPSAAPTASTTARPIKTAAPAQTSAPPAPTGDPLFDPDNWKFKPKR